MAYTLLKVKGVDVGDSIVEAEKLDVARDVLNAVAEKKVTFLLPKDHQAASEVKDGVQPQVIHSEAIPAGLKGVDIGPLRSMLIRRRSPCQNHCLERTHGVFEMPAFAEGTMQIARAVADSDAVSIVGGGDSVSAVHKAGVDDKITHIRYRWRSLS